MPKVTSLRSKRANAAAASTSNGSAKKQPAPRKAGSTPAPAKVEAPTRRSRKAAPVVEAEIVPPKAKRFRKPAPAETPAPAAAKRSRAAARKNPAEAPGKVLVKAEQPGSMMLGGDQCEIDMEDQLTVPRLALVQNTGELAESFTKGNFVYAKSIELLPEVEPAVIILSLYGGYQEVLPYESAVQARTWGTKIEAKEAGMVTFKPSDDDQGDALPYVDFTVAIQCTKDPGGFTKGSDGLFYAIAKWFLAKGAFRNAAKPILSRRALDRKGWMDNVWELSSTPGLFQKNRYFKPTVSSVGKIEEASREAIKEIVSSDAE